MDGNTINGRQRKKHYKVKQPPKPKFSDEVEAYSYAVGYMFNPLDCSRKFESGAVIPFNKNDFLELFYNKIEVFFDVKRDEEANKLTFVYRSPRGLEVGFRYKPRFVGKWWYDRHLMGRQTLYYRSKYNCCARVGFLSYDDGHKKLPWAKRFGITGRSQRFPQVGWMLLGFDLDAKNGEPDVHELLGWLLEFFPGSYFESSTGGSGIHLYVKLAYRLDHAGSLYHTLARVDDRVVRLCDQLAWRAKARFTAKIDGIRSLPTVLGFDPKKGRVIVKKRYNCVKAPRCREGMDDIYRFHTAPFYLFWQLERLVNELEREQVGVAEQPADQIMEGSLPPEEDEEEVVVVLPDAPILGLDDATVEKLIATDPAELLDGAPEDNDPSSTPLSSASSLLLYKNCTPSRDRTQTLAQIKTEDHGLRRKVGFVQWESRRLRSMQNVEHYLDRYEGLGLARRPKRDTKRVGDMTAVVKFVKRTFDPTIGFSLDGYETEKDEIEKLIGAKLVDQPDLPLTWRKEPDRTRNIKMSYLIAVYFALRRAARNGTAYATEPQLSDQCKLVIDRSPHRNLISAVTSILRRLHLIKKVAEPVFGMGKRNRGTRWRIAA